MTVPILVAAFVFLGSVAPISQTAKHELGTGQVTGVVTDIMGARVVRAKIALDGDGIAYSTTSGDDGAYSVSVKPGIYRIEVRSTGFCTDRRARFRIESQSRAIFDFVLLVCPIVNRLIIEDGKYKGETDGPEPPFKEDRLPLRTESKLDLMIRYGQKHEDDNEFRYTGFKTSLTYSFNGAVKSSERSLGVTVTYDLLTICADEVSLGKKSFELIAKGNVIVQEGARRLEAGSVRVNFKNGVADVKAH